MAKAKTKAREAERGRFAKQRANALEDQLAGLMRAAFNSGQIAYIGGLEGPLRHGIRSSLCRGGWRWFDADRAAMATVEGALRRVRAVRPTWDQGQPDCVISTGDLIERTRCAACHKPLVGEQRKYCSRGCQSTGHTRMVRRQEATREEAVWKIIQWI